MHLYFRVPNSLSDLGGLRKNASRFAWATNITKIRKYFGLHYMELFTGHTESKSLKKNQPPWLLYWWMDGEIWWTFCKKNMLTLKRNWKWKLGPGCTTTLCISEKNAFVKCHVLKTCGKLGFFASISKRFWCTKQLGHDETKQFQTAGQLS